MFSVSRRPQKAASFLGTSSLRTHLAIAEQDLLPRGVDAHNPALSEAVAEGGRVGDEGLPGKSWGRGRWLGSPTKVLVSFCCLFLAPKAEFPP